MKLRLWMPWLLALLLAGPQAVPAQPAAAGPVRFIVTLPPGGSLDVIARRLAPHMAASWGHVPATENKAGAGGTIAADYVARPSTGSTPLLVTTASTFTIVPHLFRRLPYDPDKDLRPLVQLGTTRFVLLVRSDDAARDLRALLERARDAREPVSFGSFGNGSVTHVIGEAINAAAGVRMLHVPYRGTSPAITDLLGGQLTAVISDIGTAQPFLDGRLRALAVTGGARLPALPDVPTFGEQGLASLDPYVSWVGIFVPAWVPEQTAARLAEDLSRQLRSDELKSELNAHGYEATGTTGEEFRALLLRDRQRWGSVMRQIGAIQVN